MFLQFIAPFIHAHTFGYDNSKDNAFHVHADEVHSANSTSNSLNQAQISENQIIGAITTVASGIKTSLADDIADGIAVMAILFTVVLLVFGISARFVWQPILALHSQRYFYVLQNPRAPPR